MSNFEITERSEEERAEYAALLARARPPRGETQIGAQLAGAVLEQLLPLPLQPCPFCGCEDVRLDAQARAYWMQCQECLAGGPVKATRSGDRPWVSGWERRAPLDDELGAPWIRAARAWNRRAWRLARLRKEER